MFGFSLTPSLVGLERRKAMKYAIMVLALLGVLASPRPAAVEDDNDLLDACKSGLACVTYMTGWADGSRSWYP